MQLQYVCYGKMQQNHIMELLQGEMLKEGDAVLF